MRRGSPSAQRTAECAEDRRAARSAKNQRRGWDSNPRSPRGDSGFQDRCNRPLCHPSGLSRLQLTGILGPTNVSLAVRRRPKYQTFQGSPGFHPRIAGGPPYILSSLCRLNILQFHQANNLGVLSTMLTVASIGTPNACVLVKKKRLSEGFGLNLIAGQNLRPGCGPLVLLLARCF